jgi:hypothetical protein
MPLVVMWAQGLTSHSSSVGSARLAMLGVREACVLDLGNSGSGSAAERYVRIRWHNDRRVLDDVSMRSNILKSCAKGTEVKNDAASILLHAASKM